jgi:hypothetical protein
LVINRRENARQFTFFARNETKVLIFQDKHSILCAKILSEVSGKQQEFSTWKHFHHTELLGKWTKFLVDAGLCDISMAVAVLTDMIKKHCLLKF